MVYEGKQIPAAFGRLCVETVFHRTILHIVFPAAFGRLCVETVQNPDVLSVFPNQPPSGGCVLKLNLEVNL